MNKRLLAALCCGIIIFSSGCSSQVYQESTPENTEISLETQTIDNEEYYILTAEDELEAIGSIYPLSGNYILGNDITLTDEWTPIGNSENPFTGIFNGNGYIINNLTVSKKTDEMGFFGATNGAIIKNVVLENANIDLLAFFPIVYNAEDTEIIDCSVNNGGQDQTISQQDPSAVLSFDEEEEMIESLINANYQNMTLSDFRTLTLDVFTDTNMLLSVLNDLENYFDDDSTESEIVTYSLPLTYSELMAQNNSGTFNDHIERERTSGRTVLDTLEFSCNIEYSVTYEISDGNLTVAERDNALKSVHRQMQEYINSVSEDFLSSSESGREIDMQLQSIADKCAIDGMSMETNITNISILNENGEYETVFHNR